MRYPWVDVLREAGYRYSDTYIRYVMLKKERAHMAYQGVGLFLNQHS